MSNLILLLLIFCLNTFSDYGIIATYAMQYKPKSTLKGEIPNDMIKSFYQTKTIYSLNIDGKNSLYYQDTVIGPDNMSFSFEKLMDIAYFKNFETGEGFIFDQLPKKHTGTKRKLLSNKDWNITNESKIIGNYKTIKATTEKNGRKVIAYFTEQIKIQDGPEWYSGLPGLIVRLDFEDSYVELVKFQKNVKPFKIKIPSIPNLLNEAQFEQYKNKLISGHSR